MMDFIEDQRSIVVHGVISNDVNNGFAIEDIDNFDFFEVDHRSAARTTRDVFHYAEIRLITQFVT